MNKTFYHTQEERETLLSGPIKCIRDDAWLGEAFYFWYDIEDAERWGNSAKRTTGQYCIYEADIYIANILDSVFNEEHYQFWLRQVEKVAKLFSRKTKIKPTIKELNDYLKEREIWQEVDGILFQDLPANESLLVQPIQYNRKSTPFAYRKRIQLAVYKEGIIRTFTLLKREECI